MVAPFEPLQLVRRIAVPAEARRSPWNIHWNSGRAFGRRTLKPTGFQKYIISWRVPRKRNIHLAAVRFQDGLGIMMSTKNCPGTRSMGVKYRLEDGSGKCQKAI